MRLPLSFALTLVGTAYAVAADANGDPTKGEQIFHQCQACHMVGPHPAVRIGPPLDGVVGREWASWPNYTYSAGLLAGKQQKKVWDDGTLGAWLTNPRALVPGTKMSYAGLSDASKRQDVIAYLKQFDKDGNKQ